MGGDRLVGGGWWFGVGLVGGVCLVLIKLRVDVVARDIHHNGCYAIGIPGWAVALP